MNSFNAGVYLKFIVCLSASYCTGIKLLPTSAHWLFSQFDIGKKYKYGTFYIKVLVHVFDLSKLAEYTEVYYSLAMEMLVTHFKSRRNNNCDVMCWVKTVRV